MNKTKQRWPINWTGWFASVAGSLLLASALVRFLLATSDSQLLALPDPLLGIALRPLVLFIGLVELAAALVCLFVRSGEMPLMLVAALGMNWAMYRIGLLRTESNVRESAIGSLTDPLGLTGTALGQLIQWLPVMLLAWAVILLVAHTNRQKKESPANYSKVACHKCGGHIGFPLAGIGWTIACPHCGVEVRLQNLPRI